MLLGKTHNSNIGLFSLFIYISPWGVGSFRAPGVVVGLHKKQGGLPAID